jgi:hypothetical protein
MGEVISAVFEPKNRCFSAVFCCFYRKLSARGSLTPQESSIPGGAASEGTADNSENNSGVQRPRATAGKIGRVLQSTRHIAKLARIQQFVNK